MNIRLYIRKSVRTIQLWLISSHKNAQPLILPPEPAPRLGPAHALFLRFLCSLCLLCAFVQVDGVLTGIPEG